MHIVAIVNEKGGTGKTTTSVNLAAALGKLGKKILLVDMDGQAASSRWLGVEEDTRLADAILAGGGLQPIPDVLPGVWLAPGSGKLDSIAHDLRPTQGGQLRKVIAELNGQFDMILIDCPPSLGNRLIGNALLAATDALVPVETSILALDGLRILLTMLDDIRDGFEHPIHLMGVLACRYDARTRLSRLVLAELRQILGDKVFKTVIRETVRLQECPALTQSIFEYDPKCNGATDYLALATELINGDVQPNVEDHIEEDLNTVEELSKSERLTVENFRERASAHFRSNVQKSCQSQNKNSDPQITESAKQPEPQHQEPEEFEVQIINEVPTAAPVVQQQIIESTATEQDNTSEWPEDDSSNDMPAEKEDILDVNISADAEKPADQWDDTRAESQAEQDIHQTAEQDQDSEYVFDEQAPARKRRFKPLLAGVPVILIAMAAAGWFLFVRSQSTPRKAEAMDWQRNAQTSAASINPVSSVVEAPPRVEEIQAEINKPAEVMDTQPDTAMSEVVPNTQGVEDSNTPTSAPTETALAGADPAEVEKPLEADNENSQPAQVAYRTCPDGLSLKGIMIGPRGGCALINNRAVPVGGIINGAIVTAVHPRMVEMELDGERFLLHMGSSSPSGHGSGSAAAETEESAPKQDDSTTQPQEPQPDA